MPQPFRNAMAACLAIATLLPGCAPAASRVVVPRGDLDGMAQQLDRMVRAELKQQQIEGASVVLFSDSRILWEQGFGMADKAAKRPVSPQTLFRVGSLTKAFTAAAIMRLAEDGKVSLDAPVQTYLPEFRIRSRFPEAAPVTLRHLMTHHSGLPGDVAAGMWTPRPARFTSVLPALADEQLAFPPGTGFLYSNLGYDVLGAVIERVSGKPYEAFVTASLLTPTGMTRSGFAPDPSERTLTYQNGKPVVDPELRDTPAGGLSASAHELARFGRLMLAEGQIEGRTVLKADSIRAMLRPQNPDVPADHDFRTGLGFSLHYPKLNALGRVAGVRGATVHSHAHLLLAPDKKLGIAVLTNSTNGALAAVKLAEDGLKLLAETYEGPLPDMPQAGPVHSALPSREAMTGTYATSMGTLTIDAKREPFQIGMMGQRLDLMPKQDGSFGLRFKLLGLIPLDLPPLREVAFRFYEANGKPMLVTYNAGMPAFGEKLAPTPISPTWRSRLGKYQLVNAGEDVVMLRFLELKAEQDVLVFSGQFAMDGVPPFPFGLKIHSDTEAQVAGYGLGVGQTVRVVMGKHGEELLCGGYRYRKLS